MIALPPPPRLSVVMAVHNGLPFLDDAVRSILDQTMSDFEFIIVDDGSTDGSLEALRLYDDPRITIVENPTNMGLTHCLVSAVGIARADFVARMDADDLCHPERFARQTAFLDANPDIAAAGSYFHLVDADGEHIKDVTVECDPDALYDMLPKRNNLVHASVMFRKDAYLACGGYDPDILYAQDYDLWLRMSEACKLSNLPEFLFTRRWSQGCVSCEKKTEQDQFIAIVQERARNRRSGRSSLRKNEPPVSVIVTTYNRPGVLPRSLQSLREQRHKNIEVIVVNDGGEDVGSVIEQFSDINVRLIEHEVNKGLAPARNTGIQAASGKYIGYLDDDDAYHPQHIALLVQELENADEKVAYTDGFRALQHGEEGEYRIYRRVVAASPDFDAKRMLWTNYIPVLCVMHERSCIEKAGLPAAHLGPHADWDLWVRMSQHYTFRHIAKPTCEYTWRTDSSTMTSSIQFQFWRTRRDIYLHHHEHCNAFPDVINEQKGMLRYLYERILLPNKSELYAIDAFPAAPQTDTFEEYAKVTGDFFSRVDMSNPAQAKIINSIMNTVR